MTSAMRSAAVAMLGCGLGMAMGVVHADVTIETSMSVEGVGAMAFGNMAGTTKTVIAGDKSRTDSDLKMQSKIVGFLARNAAGPSAEIVRLDQDSLYHLDINKKQYTETTFEQMRAQMQKASDQLNSGDAKQQPSVIDQSKCKLLPPKVAVNKTGEKTQIAGYEAERVTITASQPCQDPDTGSVCEIALVFDEWTAAGFAENDEVRKFYSAYAAKMGIDSSSMGNISQRARLLFSQYKGVWTEVESKMQSVKGYPVKSSFTLALGGAQCKDSSAQEARSGQSQAGDSSSGPSAIAGALAGSLGGLFHKNKGDADAPAAPPSAIATVPVPPGDVALMTVSSQLISVSTGAVSADAFMVPPTFKKQEVKM